jgi:UDP-N-acetylmuramate dehydrogenase
VENIEIHSQLCDIFGEKNVYTDEPMSRHTTFKIGGSAQFLVKPESVDQIQRAVVFFNKEQIPYFVIGNGSNLLVSDDGVRGVVVVMGENFSGYELVPLEAGKMRVHVQAGMMLGKLGNILAAKELTDFEFAAGIPGSVGGAVLMNAGAYGGEIKDIFVSATLMNDKGELTELNNEQMRFGYRETIAMHEKLFVLEAVFELQKGSKEDILAKMKDLAARRREKQPLEYPSAGSTFKRPEGHFAGKLIEDAGLKGFSVGGAKVSEKHAGFVINTGNATAADVVTLTDEIRRKVKEKFSVELELEVRKLGF